MEGKTRLNKGLPYFHAQEQSYLCTNTPQEAHPQVKGLINYMMNGWHEKIRLSLIGWKEKNDISNVHFIYRHSFTEQEANTKGTHLLNMLHSIDVAFILPFSSLTKSKVCAIWMYGAGCPVLQHAGKDSQPYKTCYLSKNV